MLKLRYRALILGLVSLLGASLAAVTPAHAAVPKCFGKKATIVGTKKGNRITGTPRNDVIVGLGGNDIIHGVDGDDTICGNGGRDTLFGEIGNDRIDLGPGNIEFGLGGSGQDLIRGKITEFDIASYAQATTSINADLSARSATGEGTDTLSGISGLEGSDQDDILIGDDGANILAGNGGTDTLDGEAGNDALYGFSNPTRENASDLADFLTGDEGNDFLAGGSANDNLDGGPDVDTLEGGTGDDTMVGGGQFLDTVDYRLATSPVTVNLDTKTANGMGSDNITGFTDIWGSAFGDTLIGSDQPNEGFAGFRGNDNINGRGGANDAIDHQFDDSGVTIDLAAGTATGSFAGTDTVSQIESAQGSNSADTMSGDDGRNEMYGLGGPDTMVGRLGDDYLDGGDGNDTLNGGDGTDTCLAGESLASCESTVPPARTGRNRAVARLVHP